MAKYRITNELQNDLKLNEFYIERKRLFGWKAIEIKENNDSNLLKFNTYEEAECYLFKNYCRNVGRVYQPTKNEYHYTPYTYSY